MKTPRKNGFTEIEMLIASVAGVIVLYSAATVLVGGQKSWGRAWDRMNLQREASYALQAMTHTILPATSVAVDSDQKGIKVNGENGWKRYVFLSDAHELQCQIENGPDDVVIARNVKDVTFMQTGRLVKIVLELEEGTIEARLDSSVKMRN